MANADHVKAFEKGVKYWNNWRNVYSIDKPDLSRYVCFGPSDCTNINLNDSNLSGSYFLNVNFDQAKIQNCNWGDSEIINCSLQNADLRNTSALFSKFNGSVFCNSNLSEFNSISCDFSGADFENVNLSRAILSASIFWGANLTNAILTDSDLSSVNFTAALLRRTNFENAKIAQTLFLKTSLNDAINLDSLFSKERSIIDIDTIIASKSQLSTLIIKIGIPMKSESHSLKILDDSKPSLYPVFLSHSSNDKIFATKLYNKLSSEGCQVWYDEHKIKPGDVIHKEIHKGIEQFDKLLLVCSQKSLNSWWVQDEIDKTLAKERALKIKHNKEFNLIVPIKIDDYIHSWNHQYRSIIEKRSISDFSNWNNEQEFIAKTKELLEGLSVHREDEEILSFL